jgi:hypothetical protein
MRRTYMPTAVLHEKENLDTSNHQTKEVIHSIYSTYDMTAYSSLSP